MLVRQILAIRTGKLIILARITRDCWKSRENGIHMEYFGVSLALGSMIGRLSPSRIFMRIFTTAVLGKIVSDCVDDTHAK